MDLKELAGIKVQTKAVERVAEGIGAELEALGQRERQRAINDQKVVLLKSVSEAVRKLRRHGRAGNQT